MFEIAIIVLLILLNGVFALSELAIVSSRRIRLKAMAESGRHGAKRALALADDPGRFLSTVQIGITLVGILAGAFSGATLGARLSDIMESFNIPATVADPLGFTIVIIVITYLSLVIGELVPKHIALRNAEPIACAVAPFMTWLSRVAAPAGWVLEKSTRGVFWLIGHKTGSEKAVTEEEIKSLIAEAETAGVIETGEREMISGVMRLGDRAVRGLMTPRTDVDWIDLSDGVEEVRKRLVTTSHSRLPVGEGTPDEMIGVVQTREILAGLLSGQPLDVRRYVRNAAIIPETMDALDVLTILRDAEVPMALVHDEYGHFDGLVTPADILEAIAGVFRSDTDDDFSPHAVQRDDGSWLLSGSMPADEMAEQLGFSLPQNRDYQTVAGFVLAHLRQIPATGEYVDAMGWRFEVVDLDGRRVDKILASPGAAVRRRAG